MFITIAGFTIKLLFIPSAYPFQEEKLKKDINVFFKGFLDKKMGAKPHFTIEICDIPRSFDTQSVNQKKHYVIFYEDVSSNRCRTYYSIHIYQFQLMVQNIIHQLLTKNNGFLLHSSASLINDKAVLFLGKSGAGKSTSVNLLKDTFTPLADDMSVIRKVGAKYYFFQHPFRETNTIKGKNSHPIKLGTVFLIVKKPYFSVNRRIKTEKKIQLIIQQLISPTKKMAGNALKFSNVHAAIYELRFAKESNQFINLLIDA